jgi:urea transporter/murein DD-endopeptidase MepM/ murein hydrolase activator NlpD
MTELREITRNKYISSVLNSYSVIFFFNNKPMGLVLLMVSFFNFQAGMGGLIAVLTAVAVAGIMGFDEIRLKQGIYSFNALLTGIGMGTLFEPGIAWVVLLLLAALFSLMLSVALSGWLGKYGLPFLSIPFVLSFWLVLLPSSQFSNLGLTERNIFWMNEMYSVGGRTLLNIFETIENISYNKLVTVYFRSLSSIIFQDNILTGILIAAALLISSRIAFLLSVTGFLAAYGFGYIAGSDLAGMSFYNIGANYILVAIAAGGFFVIPSSYSFLWVVFLVPLTSLLILFLNKFVGFFGLSVFSLPFSIISIIFIYFLMLRIRQRKLFLTPFQYYSPEVNLYTFRNSIDRKTGAAFFPIHLPFWGEWKVAQGYDGQFTHKEEWSKALDFTIADDSGRTYGVTASSCDDYYCYNKPILAPADGTVADIIDNIPDNEPGKVNSLQNWGNTIVLRHHEGLYTQMSHIKPGSFRVKKDDFVKKGQVLGLCGNSGRSPEPHLHFQVQATPLPGAKPIEYPLSYYFLRSKGKNSLMSFTVPSENNIVSDIVTNQLLNEAYNLQPGMLLNFRYSINESAERNSSWEVFTDAWNNRYLFCKASQSFAYFVNDGNMFYFTSFHGNKKSLLYYFYLASYKIFLGYYENLVIKDIFPVHIVARSKILLWLNDFAAPFKQLMKTAYSVKPQWSDSSVSPVEIRLSSYIAVSYFSGEIPRGSGSILISDDQIKEFTFESNKTMVWAKREII